MTSQQSPRLAEGTHTQTETFTRAHLPDGRIQDSPVRTAGNLSDTMAHLAGLFGRTALPAGTRYEQFERTVTTTVDAWTAVDQQPAAGVR